MVEKFYVTYNQVFHPLVSLLPPFPAPRELESGISTARTCGVCYNRADNESHQVHKLCQDSADRILNDFQPNLMIAIGGGGYVPARILRYAPGSLEDYAPFRCLHRFLFKPHHTPLTRSLPRSFLKRPGSANIPIQAIGLSLYENLGKDGPVEEPGTVVTRTQWLDLSSLEMANLIGKDVLIVDEVDDTRTTLEYAVRELEKDVETARQKMGRDEKTRFSVFVLHNKDKPKKGHLPKDMMEDKRYLAAVTVPDVWICYPWEATDIDEHDKLAETKGMKQ